MEIEYNNNTQKKYLSGRNYFSELNYHIKVHILQFLDVTNIFVLSRINKELNELIKSTYFWENMNKIQSSNNYYRINNVSFQLQDQYQINRALYKQINFQKQQQSLQKEESNIQNITLKPIISSSTDYSQSIYNTIKRKLHQKNFGWGDPFWSSTGTKEINDRTEYLIYQFEQPTLITEILLRFYYAQYHNDNLYLCKQLRFYSGLASDNFQLIHEVNMVDQSTLTNEQRRMMVVNFETKNLALSHFLKIEFMGKQGIQDTDRQYYTCVDLLSAKGIQLSLDKDDPTHELADCFFQNLEPTSKQQQQQQQNAQEQQQNQQQQYDQKEEQKQQIKNEETSNQQTIFFHKKQRKDYLRQKFILATAQYANDQGQVLKKMIDFFQIYPEAYNNSLIYQEIYNISQNNQNCKIIPQQFVKICQQNTVRGYQTPNECFLSFLCSLNLHSINLLQLKNMNDPNNFEIIIKEIKDKYQNDKPGPPFCSDVNYFDDKIIKYATFILYEGKIPQQVISEAFQKQNILNRDVFQVYKGQYLTEFLNNLKLALKYVSDFNLNPQMFKKNDTENKKTLLQVFQAIQNEDYDSDTNQQNSQEFESCEDD